MRLKQNVSNHYEAQVYALCLTLVKLSQERICSKTDVGEVKYQTTTFSMIFDYLKH